MTGEVFIYQIRMGSLGEYVFCATSLMDLYKRIFHGNESLKWEILRNRDNTAFISFEEFKTNWEKYITKSPFHLGYLGGYSE